MAECFWPGVTAQKVADAGERIREASHAAGGGFARHDGSILIPSDEIALFFLEAASLEAAAELSRQAAVPSERILEIVRLGAFLPECRDNPTARQRSLHESSP